MTNLADRAPRLAKARDEHELLAAPLIAQAFGVGLASVQYGDHWWSGLETRLWNALFTVSEIKLAVIRELALAPTDAGMLVEQYTFDEVRENAAR